MHPPASRTTVIHIDGVGDVTLQRSDRACRVIISVRPFRGVRVAVPKRVSFRRAEQVAREKVEWIRTHLEQTRRYEAACEEAAKTAGPVDRGEAAKILIPRLEELARKHGYRYNRVTIRNQKTRWGSCSAHNNISLNMKLIRLPEDLRDFVLLHELVHTRIRNHGKEFRAELLRIEPRARELDRELGRYDPRLL
ncbi:MAG: hypothetical protein Kow0089_04360 [Desulfobulbaceae bacterium]